MTQQRLNDLLLLHIHKSETDSMDLTEVANEFVPVKEPRLRMFENFNG